MQEEEEGPATPEEESAPAPSSGGFGERLRQRAARNVPSAAGTPAPRTPAAAKEIVDGLDRTERNIGIGAVVVAVVWSVLAYFVAKHSHVKTTHDGAGFGLLTDLVLALIITLGLGTRRRALLGFGAMFFGLATLHYGVVGVAFLAFGGWLVFRASRKQKQIREANGGRTPSRATTASSKAPQRPGTPKASKRYTPPRRSAGSGRR